MQPAFAPTRTDPGLALGAERLSRFDVAGPRYTSYPTADRFVETFGAPQYRQALARHAFDGQGGGGPAPLSLRAHSVLRVGVLLLRLQQGRHQETRARACLPGCPGVRVRSADALLGESQDVVQLHLGGGTPTFLSDAQLDRLMRMLRRGLRLMPGAECSIEVDPRTVTEERLAHLSSLGFDRLSFGVIVFSRPCKIRFEDPAAV